jgi:hypothetical protein
MYLLRIECHSFAPSHRSHGAKSLERSSIRFKGADTSFSRPRQCHTEENVLGIERALASFHAAVAKDYGLEEATRAVAIGSKNSRKPVQISVPTGVP